MADFRFVLKDPALANNPAVKEWLEKCANALEVEMLLMPEAEFAARILDPMVDMMVTGEGLSIQETKPDETEDHQ